MSVCSHYIRRCALVTPCCEKSYPCRFCHDKEENHELDRSSVEFIKCTQCSTIQEVGLHCTECGIRFGMYACLECRLFDDQDKEQFHCDKCGVCRVGGSENFFHCDNCEICLKISLIDSHKCRSESGKDRCPVCFEYVHTASEPSFVPSCGHLIHFKCYNLIQKFGHLSCPICMQSYNQPATRTVGNVNGNT